MRRGRPRYDDILTPREWQVLDLLREGLTNEQIAARLSISYDTAKFHVSEILGKLEVQTREEAAAWQGRPKVAFGLALLLAILHKPPHAGWLAIGVAAVALVVLAAGVLIMAVRDGSDDEPAAVATPGETATATVTATTAPGLTPTPASGTREPPFAPDGRTGDARLDAIIEDVLTADVATLAERYAQARVSSDFGASQTPADVWPQRLAAADRRLHAVYRREVHQDIFLEITTPAGDLEGWQVIVQAGRVLEIRVHTWADQDRVTPENLRQLVLPTPDVARNYSSYLVLPPQDQLPPAPPVHSIATRVGVPGVDDILEALATGDEAALVQLLTEPDALRVRQCGGSDAIQGPGYGESWAQRVVAQTYGLQAVSRVPDGFYPAADHVIVIGVQVDRFWWQANGIIEREGEIVAVIEGDNCTQHGTLGGAYYPGHIAPGTRTYLLPPPPDGTDGLGPHRNSLRTGVAMVDAVLDALESKDEVALAGLIEYTDMECADYDYAPRCPPGVASGTRIPVLPYSVCHGGSASPDSAPTVLIDIFAEQYVYTILGNPSGPPVAPGQEPREGAAIVLAHADRGGTRTIGVGANGVRSISGSCGDHHPEWVIGSGPPDYLLAPP